jgi:hypothetical protein
MTHCRAASAAHDHHLAILHGDELLRAVPVCVLVMVVIMVVAVIVVMVMIVMPASGLFVTHVAADFLAILQRHDDHVRRAAKVGADMLGIIAYKGDLFACHSNYSF